MMSPSTDAAIALFSSLSVATMRNVPEYVGIVRGGGDVYFPYLKILYVSNPKYVSLLGMIGVVFEVINEDPVGPVDPAPSETNPDGPVGPTGPVNPIPSGITSLFVKLYPVGPVGPMGPIDPTPLANCDWYK